jgi:hypothetical protein
MFTLKGEKMIKNLYAVLIAFCLVSLMTGCESYEEQQIVRVEHEKARLMPFEYIKDFNIQEDGYDEHFRLICDHSTGVVYLKYSGWRSAGLTPYLDENLNVVRCDKTMK